MANQGRQITMGGPGPITPSEIECVLRLLNITDPDEQADYRYMIAELNEESLEYWDKTHGNK